MFIHEKFVKRSGLKDIQDKIDKIKEEISLINNEIYKSYLNSMNVGDVVYVDFSLYEQEESYFKSVVVDKNDEEGFLVVKEVKGNNSFQFNYNGKDSGNSKYAELKMEKDMNF